MKEHEKIWNAIYKLAELNKLSPSKLAKKSGLDKTTFNKSKQFYKTGQARWPSTESIYKILKTTNTTIEEFCKLIK